MTKLMSRLKSKLIKKKKHRVITTLEELDKELFRLNELAAISDDMMRSAFRDFIMKFDLTGLPKDPKSTEYRNWWLSYYNRIAGKPYNVSNELTPYNPTELANAPFPYCTKSYSTVANQMESWARILRALALPINSSVLEMGHGWGNLIIPMAQMGYDVTGVDIDKNHHELVKIRSANNKLNITLVHDEFNSVKKMNKSFDAVLFCACFHHCVDHYDMLQILKSKLKPDGKIVFADEPIIKNYEYPWGLRCDAETMRAVRGSGWMELGFDRKYFMNMLSELGFNVTRVPINIFVATKK